MSEGPVTDPYAMQRAAEALEQLMHSDGWKIFLGYMKLQRDVALRHIEDVESDTSKILRSSGALAQLRELAKWPESQAKALRMQIKQLETKGK